MADYKKGPFGSALKKSIFVPKDDSTVKVYEQQNAINKDWKLERYFITKEYAEKLKGFKVSAGDIIVSCAGTIGEIYELPMDAESGIINQALMRIRVHEDRINKKMFIILFTNMIDEFTRVHSNGSAIKNIPPFSDLKPMKVLVPTFDEQNKIAHYFYELDNLITLHQRKCEETKKLKKYMLQKMFPQNGKRVPEIRFAGFTDDWEQRKYAEVIELLSGQDFNPEEYNEDGIGIPYLTGASCIENGCTTAVRWTEKPRCIAEKGDTVLVCKGSGYGTIATVNQEKAHIARQFMALKVKKHELDNRFNYFLLNSVVENIKTDARGLIAGIARDAVLKQEIVIPCLNEQTKIGEYFENLDRLITLHQRKYEELQKIKKFMLQNMFI